VEIKTVAVAGGSGFIGGAIARRLARIQSLRVRVITRNPNHARARNGAADNIEFTAGDLTDPVSLERALDGAGAIINAAQFDGYPVENPSRGLTFERVDYGGTVALLEAAKKAGAACFVYISGAAADENSAHPAFRAKGRAERAIRESGLSFTILRPALVYGPEDRVINAIASALRFTPVMLSPGTGRQRLQPVLAGDIAACVALAVSGRGRGGAFDIGGPELMTFDDLLRLVMEITGRRRPIVHVPENMMRLAGAIAERLPGALFSRDAAGFLVADSPIDNGPLLQEFQIRLTAPREGMAYLARN
jgi:NADH dehydrogenase